MDLIQLLTLQFIAHLLADFIFQTDKWVEARINKGVRSRYFTIHLIIVFVLSLVLSFQWNFIYGALIITLIHGIIDILKMRFSKSLRVGKYSFFIDQFLHLIVILVVTWLYLYFFEIKLWFSIPINNHHLIIAAGYLFCTKPANIFIKEILRFYNIRIVKNNPETTELPNAGKLIGNVERLLTLTFVLLGRYEAVGFLIAAKSILRFGEKDTTKSEYVLIGTLLSFGIAIITGVVIELFYKHCF